MSEEQTDTLVAASFFERIVAFIIDIFFLNLVLFVLGFFAIKINFITSENGLKIYTYFVYIATFLYFTIFNKFGKTLGKFLVGIEVINKDEENSLTFKQSFLRSIGYIFDILTLTGGILLGLFNKKKRTLHDFMGSSIVISTRKKSQTEELALTVVGTVFVVTIILFAYYIFFKQAPLFFDERKIDQARTQLDNLAYLEEVHKQTFGYYTDDLRRLSLISGDGVQLNRDLQRAFQRRGFKIGLSQDKTSYRIEGYAKDANGTLVFKEKL